MGSRKISLHKLVSKLSEVSLCLHSIYTFFGNVSILLAERHKGKDACIQSSSTESDDGLEDAVLEIDNTDTNDDNNTYTLSNTNNTNTDGIHKNTMKNNTGAGNGTKPREGEDKPRDGGQVSGPLTLADGGSRNSTGDSLHTKDNLNTMFPSEQTEEEVYEPIDLSTVRVNTNPFPYRRPESAAPAENPAPTRSSSSDTGAINRTPIPMVVLGGEGTVPKIPPTPVSATTPVSDPALYRITPYITPPPALHYQGRFLGQKIFQYSSDTIAAVSTPQFRGGVHVADIVRPSSSSYVPSKNLRENTSPHGPPAGKSEGGNENNTKVPPGSAPVTRSRLRAFLETNNLDAFNTDDDQIAPCSVNRPTAGTGEGPSPPKPSKDPVSGQVPASAPKEAEGGDRGGASNEENVHPVPGPDPNMPKSTPGNYLTYAHHSVDYLVRYISLVHVGLTDLIQGLSKIQKKKGVGGKTEGAENEDTTVDPRTSLVARANAAHILCSSAMNLVNDLKNTVLAAQTAMRDEELGQGYIKSNVSALHYVEIETDIIDVPWNTNTAFINATVICLPEPAVTQVYRNTVYYFLNQMRLYGTSCQICISCVKQEPLYQLRTQLKNIQNLCVTLIIKNHSFSAVPSYSNRIARQMICDEEAFIQAHPLRGTSTRARQGFVSYKYAMLVSSTNLGDLICAGHVCLQACYNFWPIVHVYTRRCRGPL
nr:spliced ORF-K glycoprotein [Elephant endotheliotropic herpesvirus 2]